MRDSNNVFHLAIPCKNLQETADYYTTIGALVARRYDDRVTLNFFGDQIVCHLVGPDEIDLKPKMYPRHAGLTFSKLGEYQALLELATKNNLPFFKNNFIRFKGKREEHQTFFLIDPANNLLEFKYYNDPAMMY